MTTPDERITALETEMNQVKAILRRVRNRTDPPTDPGPGIPPHQRKLPRAPRRPREPPSREEEPTEPDP